jgi:hypothetical protein
MISCSLPVLFFSYLLLTPQHTSPLTGTNATGLVATPSPVVGVRAY